MVTLVRDLALAAAAVGALLLAFSAIVPPAPAAAQAMPSGTTLRQACAGDVRKLCPGIAPGGGRIQKCFVEKYEQVSPACKSAMDEARAMKANGAK